MSEVDRQEKCPALPTPANGGTRDAGRTGGAGSSVKNQLRATPGFDAQAALLTPVQRKPDPFTRGPAKSPNGKPAGGACSVADAPAKPFARAVKREAKPGQAPDVGDVADPRTCQEEGLEVANVESVDDRPDDAALFVIANDAATEAVAAMTAAMTQRMMGFDSAAQYLADSAKVVNEDKDALLAFVEKAFSVVTLSLLGMALAPMAAAGAVGLLKGLIIGTFTVGKDAVAAKIGEAAKGDQVSWPAFAAATTDLIAQQSLLVAQTWKVADLRTRFLNAPYPHRVAAAAVTGTEAIRDNAYRMQLTSSVTSWANKVNEVKGGDAGVLVVEVSFDPSGSYSVDKCEVPVMGEKFAELLTKDQNTGSGRSGPLTLAETLTSPTGGMKVIVRDQSQATYTWDPAQKAIATPDAELMHHRVGAWGIAKLGQGKVPIIYAHGFLFQALGARTFGELGVGR